MSGFLTCLKRELRLAIKRLGDILTLVLFFVITLSLFPFGLGTEKVLLQQVAPSIVWVVAMLAVLLSLDQLLARDQTNGVIDHILLSPLSSLEYGCAKWLANWLTTALPLMLVTPLLSLLYFMPGQTLMYLMLSLLIATPSLTSLGLIASALTLGARNSSLLIPLLALPLMIPVLIFGVGAVNTAVNGTVGMTPWYASGALTFALFPLSLGATSLALRANRS